MVKFFAMQVRLGRITLYDVPEKYREGVASLLGEVTE